MQTSKLPNRPITDLRAIDSHVGQRIREIRRTRRLSMEEMGRQAGITYQQIQKYESGSNRVSASMLYMIATILGVEVSDFYAGLECAQDKATESTASEIDQIADRAVRSDVRRLVQGILRISR